MPPLTKFQDSQYRNWVRAALGLFYLQEGLRDFVNDVVKCQHSKLLQNVRTAVGNPGTQCTRCHVANILPAHYGKTCIQKKDRECNCRRRKNKHCQFCSNMYDEIIRHHRYSDPNWETDASKWFTDHWQLAKCFLTTTSKSADNTAAETDASGLLSIIINASFFGSEINSKINVPYDDFSQARLTRNQILHSPTLQLTDTKVVRYLQIMIIALEDKKTLLYDQAAKKAVENLKQLQNDKLLITTETENKALEMAIESKKEECIQELDRKEKESLLNIQELDSASETKKKECLEEIECKKKESLLVIKKEKDSVTELRMEIEDKGKETLLVINQGKDTVKNLKAKIEDKGKEAVSTVEKETHNILVQLKADIDKKGKETLLSIKTETEDATEAKREDVIREIEKKEKEFIMAIQEGKDKVMEKKSECVAGIERKEEEFLQVIKSEKDKAITDLTIKAASVEDVERLKENICKLDDNLQDIEKRLSTTETTIGNLNEDIRMQADELKERISPLDTYIQQKQGLKTHMVGQYAEYIKADVSPFFPEEDVRLSKVFVPVKMSRKKQSGETAQGKEREECINSLNDIFNCDAKERCNILVCGEAGVGKTTFCKALISKWCDAQSEIKTENNSLSTIFQGDGVAVSETYDVEGMTKFDFLFYVSLRHTHDETFVEDMICNQLFFPEQKPSLFDVLTKESEKCLVILDGLDEWSPPKGSFHSVIKSGFPKSRFQYTILTTTRPCGVNLHHLSLKDIDLQVYLEGLGITSVHTLTKSTVLELNKQLRKRVFFWKFKDEISKMELKELCRTPIVLKLLVCLWFDEQSLGKSFCAIYSAIIDLMVKHANTRFKNDQSYQLAKTNLGKSDISLPNCFVEKGSCQNIKPLLISVSKLAFHALFSQDQSSSLAFKGDDIMQHGLSENEFHLSQKIGLIAVSKIPSHSAINRYQKFSFPHKSLQEFFAAIYMAMNLSTKEPLHGNVIQALSTFQGILQYSIVLKFLSGLSPEKVKYLFKFIGSIYKDEKINTIYVPKTTKLAIQDMVFHCIEEGSACGHKNVQLPISELDIDINTKLRLRPNNLDYTCLNKLIIHDERSAVENNFLNKLLSGDHLHMATVVLENISLTSQQLNMLLTKTLSLSLKEIDLSDLDDCVTSKSGTVMKCSYITKDFVLQKAKINCCGMTQLVAQIFSVSSIERVKVEDLKYSSKDVMWKNAKCKTLTTVQTNPNIRVLDLRYVRLPKACIDYLATMLLRFIRLRHMELIELYSDEHCKCTLNLKEDFISVDVPCQVLKHMLVKDIPTQKSTLFDSCLTMFLTADVICLEKLSFTRNQMEEVLLHIADSAKIANVSFRNIDCTIFDPEDNTREYFCFVLPSQPFLELKMFELDDVRLAHDQIDMMLSMLTQATRCNLISYKISDVRCEADSEERHTCLLRTLQTLYPKHGYQNTNRLLQRQNDLDTETYFMFNMCLCWR